MGASQGAHMYTQPSVMTSQEHFAKVQTNKMERSVFDRSHGYKTTFNAGNLIPIFVDEALPGDTMKLSVSQFSRISTLINPIMDNVYVDVHFFSVPMRLVWNNWKRFNGEQDSPLDSTDYLMPTTTSPIGGFPPGSLADCMGLPTKLDNLEVRTDFFRAYNLIWNTWYRDENLQDSVFVNKDDGPDDFSEYEILKRNKRKDYFTSALPFAQKAAPVTIPLGTQAPITSDALTGNKYSILNANGLYTELATGGSSLTVAAGVEGEASKLYADLSSATAATVNAWREAFQLQVLFELDSRGGTRYNELIRTHFKVTPPDYRLQIPEVLSIHSFPLVINPIAQTAEGLEASVSSVGDLGAMGTVSGAKKGFNKTFTEHEIIIGLASARVDLNYQQGINRMWSRSTRFDFYWPSLAHLGEQEILNKEIYASGQVFDDEVFGYQERYAEYRYKPSQITGLFRSNATTSLDVWHLAQDFQNLPTLNSEFITENPPMERVLAVSTEDSTDFISDFFFDYKCARPMPTYAVPIDLNRL